MIALLRRVADPGKSEGALWAGMRVHLVTELGYSSKLNAEWDFLCMLRDEGRRVAEAFLRAYGEISGAVRRSTSTGCSKRSEAMGCPAAGR